MSGFLVEALRAVLACAAVAVPGAALARRFTSWRADPFIFLTYAALLGYSAYAVSFWWLRWLPLSLAGLAAAWSAAGALLLAWPRRGVPEAAAGFAARKTMLLVATLFVIQFALRLVPFPLCPVAPGIDMSMHTAIARLILDADGVPASYRPFYPVDHFGPLPAGLPAVAAVTAKLSGQPVWRTAFLLACLTYVLLSLSLYTLARRRVMPAAAAIAAVAISAGAKDPQLHFLWGGNPSALALVLVIAALPLLEDLTTERWRAALPPAALLLAAAVLTHPIVPAAAVYAIGAVGLVRLIRTQRRDPATIAVRGGALAAAVAAATAPFLLALRNPLSDAEAGVTRSWHDTALQLPAWASGSSLLAGPEWLLHRLGPVALLTVALALVLGGRNAVRRRLGEEALFSGVVLLVAANSLVQVLPYSLLLYPDRVITLLVLPGTLAVAKALQAAEADARGRSLPRLTAGFGLALCLGVGLPLAYWYWYLQGVRYMAVTSSDVATISWIAASTPPGTVIANNYGDAGTWIPAIAARPVTSAHAHFLFGDEYRQWAERQTPPLIFVGAKAVAPGIRFTSAALARQPWRYQRVFRLGRSEVYRDGQVRGGGAEGRPLL